MKRIVSTAWVLMLLLVALPRDARAADGWDFQRPEERAPRHLTTLVFSGIAALGGLTSAAGNGYLAYNQRRPGLVWRLAGYFFSAGNFVMAMAWLAPPFGTRPSGENTTSIGLTHIAIGGVGLGLTLFAQKLRILRHISLQPALLRGPGGHTGIGLSIEFHQ